MSTQIRIRIAVLLSMAVLFTLPAQASENTIASPVQDPGLLAAETAAAAGQFLMVLFQKTGDPSALTEFLHNLSNGRVNPYFTPFKLRRFAVQHATPRQHQHRQSSRHQSQRYECR